MKRIFQTIIILVFSTFLTIDSFAFFSAITKGAKVLSKFGDIYVNDAFSCSHRAHASVTKITDYLPSFCGLQMDQEINALKKITSETKKSCIIATHNNLLAEKMDRILLIENQNIKVLK